MKFGELTVYQDPKFQNLTISLKQAPMYAGKNANQATAHTQPILLREMETAQAQQWRVHACDSHYTAVDSFYGTPALYPNWSAEYRDARSHKIGLNKPANGHHDAQGMPKLTTPETETFSVKKNV